MKQVVSTVVFGVLMILSTPLLFILALISLPMEHDYVGEYVNALRKGFQIQ